MPSGANSFWDGMLHVTDGWDGLFVEFNGCIGACGNDWGASAVLLSPVTQAQRTP